MLTEAKYASHQLIPNGYFDLNLSDKAYVQGWNEGCPVRKRLIEVNGAETMIHRYGPINYLFGQIADVMKRAGRQDLLAGFNGPITRQTEEPLGEHDEGYVPAELNSKILSTVYGYTLPRLVNTFVGKSQGDFQFYEARQERLMVAMNEVEKLVVKSPDLTSLLISLTESLIQNGGDAKLLVKNMLPSGKLREDNCYKAYGVILSKARECSPLIWGIYSSLTPEEKVKLGMANLN